MAGRRKVHLIGLVAMLTFAGGAVIAIAFGDRENIQRQFGVWLMGGVYLGNKGSILQSSANGCGPAAMKMIFDHYGIICTINEIRREIRVTAKGSTLLSLKELSESKGLHAEGWRFGLDDLPAMSFPALLFINGDHFVLADSITGGEVYLRDPAIGVIRIPSQRLARIWEGEALVFKR